MDVERERQATPTPSEQAAASEEQPPTKRPRMQRKAKVSPLTTSITGLEDFLTVTVCHSQPVQFDAVITLTDEQINESRRSYPRRMLEEKDKLEHAQAEKEGTKRAHQLIFGPSALCERSLFCCRSDRS